MKTLPLGTFATMVWISSVSLAQDPQLQPVTQRMQQFVDQGRISGAVTLVAHEGDIVHLSAVGLADIESERPMTEDSLFAIASMTKPITATAVMVLEEEGKLSIDDPVEKHLPAFANAKLEGGEPVEGLTIRRLLTHTSGLGGDQGTEDSLEDVAQRLANRPFDFQPGERWQYGPSLNACGRIIEVVSGQPYEAFLAERIFQPLAMKDTTFHPTPEQFQRVPTLYARENGELEPTERPFATGEPGSVANPSGGLFSTARDMSRFYQAILNGGELDGHRIVSEESVRRMTTPQTGDLATGFTPGNAWGLGWCVVREPEGVTGMLSPGTFGHGGAFGTQGWVDPERKAIFVLMIQRSDLPNSDGSEIREEFQRAAVVAMAPH